MFWTEGTLGMGKYKHGIFNFLIFNKAIDTGEAVGVIDAAAYPTSLTMEGLNYKGGKMSTRSLDWYLRYRCRDISIQFLWKVLDLFIHLIVYLFRVHIRWRDQQREPDLVWEKSTIISRKETITTIL